MAKRNTQLRTQCDFELTMDIIGSKWKGVIIYHLFKGTRRFVELKNLMPTITPRMLTLQLRQLEKDKVISRKVYAEVPPRVEYSLTEIGKALDSVFVKINEWGKLYKNKGKKCGG
jgi:DNA-binding HxlR family transcriptional regulator